MATSESTTQNITVRLDRRTLRRAKIAARAAALIESAGARQNRPRPHQIRVTA